MNVTTLLACCSVEHTLQCCAWDHQGRSISVHHVQFVCPFVLAGKSLSWYKATKNKQTKKMKSGVCHGILFSL